MQNYGRMSDEAKEAAAYLAEALEQHVILSTFALADGTTIGSSSIETDPIEGVPKPNEFSSPSIPALHELEDFKLLRVRESLDSRGYRRWEIHLFPQLKEFAHGGQKTPTKLFISYSHQDLLLRRFIEPGLNDIYSSIWRDDELRGGDRWWPTILSEIAQSDVFIILLSKDSIQSLYCRGEFSEALRLQKEIIPIVIRYTRYIPLLILDEYQLVNIWDETDVTNIPRTLNATIEHRLSKMTSKSELWSRPTPLPRVVNRFTIHANQDPSEDETVLSTGVFLMSGDKIEITATGLVTIDTTSARYDPSGMFTDERRQQHPYAHPDVYPTEGLSPQLREAGYVGLASSLMGWIGSGNFRDSAFYVGKDKTIEVQDGQEGFLYLALNDVKGQYADNGGEFEVRIKVDRA